MRAAGALEEGRQVKLAEYSDSRLAGAVSAFDARFGEMERVLWCLSVKSRAGLLGGKARPCSRP